MNLANKLTIFRIILVPLMVIVPFFGIEGQILGIPITYLIMDLIFIIASITDKLDGYIARSRNQVTTLFLKSIINDCIPCLVNSSYFALKSSAVVSSNDVNSIYPILFEITFPST